MKPFDEQLYALKLQEALVPRMHRDTQERRHKVLSHQRDIGQALAGALPKLVDSDIGLIRDYIPEVDRVCRETWLSDGIPVTAEFIRNVLVHRVFNFIAVREGDSRGNLERLARRCGIGGHLTPTLHHLVLSMSQLKSEVANRYEIEAIEFSKKESRARMVTQALPPPHKVGGLGITHSHAKSTQIPPNPPAYFPSDLWPKTVVIFTEAVRKFPHQTDTLELCKHVVSEMIPVFRTAVEVGTIRPDRVFSDAGMEGLLHSLLVYNCDRDEEGLRLARETRRSDAWLRLAKEINEATPRNRELQMHLVDPGLVRLRLIDYSLHRLEKESDERLAVLLGDWQDRVERLRQANPDWSAPVAGRQTEADFLMMQAEEALRQIRTALALRGKLPVSEKANSASATESASSTGQSEREMFVNSILIQKGWSVNRLSVESELDFHTVNDYLKNRTNPNPSSRKQLADALGVSVEKLPR